MSKNMRRKRKLLCEHLQERALFAGFQPTLSDGVLAINGSNDTETVDISGLPGNVIRVISSPGGSFDFPASQVRSIRINAHGGNDRIDINRWYTNYTPVGFNADSIDIVMSGANVGINVWNQRAVGQINIDTTGSGQSNITVGVNSLNGLDIKSGNSVDSVYLTGKIGNARVITNDGDDSLVADQLVVTNLLIRTGQGNDSVNLRRQTQIGNVNANLGRGQDRLYLNDASVDSGTISGGRDNDTVFNLTRKLRRVTRSFEFKG